MPPARNDRTLSGSIEHPLHAHGVDRKTLEMLVCPLTKTRLVLGPDKTELISPAARLAFPIRNGVPLLNLDEARPVDEDEMGRILGRHKKR